MIKITRSKEVEIRPRYLHDCKDCVYIGTVEINTEIADIYFHKYDNGVTIIARKSSHPENYIAAPVEYISVFNEFLCAGFSMYLKHMGVKSFNGNSRIEGNFYNEDGGLILSM